MKTLFCILLFISALTVCAQEVPNYCSPYEYPFEKGDIIAVFGDNVKLRSEASTSGKVLALLAFNSSVTILEKTEETMVFDGIESNWYKIKTDTQTGYVLGALLSLEQINAYDNTDFLFQYTKEEDKYFLKIRNTVATAEKYVELKEELLNPELKIEILNNKGLAQVTNIIALQYVAEACGVEGGTTYLTWNGIDLKYLADVSSIVDGGIFSWQEKLIFPEDSSGHDNTIYFQSTIITNEDEQRDYRKETTQSIAFIWVNGTMDPPFDRAHIFPEED